MLDEVTGRIRGPDADSVTTSGDAIPDNNHVARWCKTRDKTENKPSTASLAPRQDEKYLSGNWLEYLAEYLGQPGVSRDDAVNLLRGHTTLRLSPRGCFIALNAVTIREAIVEGGAASPSVAFKPDIAKNNPSHVAIKWADFPVHEQTVAAAIVRQVTDRDVFPHKAPGPD